GKAERNVTLKIADVRLHAQGLAQSQKVVGAVAEPNECTRQTAHATAQANTVLPFLMDFESQIYSAFFFVQVPFCDIGIVGLQIVKKTQLVQPLDAELPKVLIVNLTFFQNDLAADHLIASRSISLKLNPPHIELLALVHVDIEKDAFLILVEGSVGNGGKVDVPKLAVCFPQIFQAFRDFTSVEGVAVFDREQAAQCLDVAHCLIV